MRRKEKGRGDGASHLLVHEKCKWCSLPRGANGLWRPHFFIHQRICSLDQSPVSATSEEKGLQLLSLQGPTACPGLVKMQVHSEIDDFGGSEPL